MATVHVRSRIATTHPISAYGGFQLDEEEVRKIAAAVATGVMPMLIDHDITRPIDASNIEAGVERLDDGHLAAWAEFDADADAWAEFEAERDALGAPGGMSFSFVKPIPDQALEEEPLMVVAADAGYFDDATITEASRRLSAVAPTQPGRLYQFAVGPDAKVLIEIIADGLGGIALNMIASGLYDAVKTFLKSGRSTVFSVVAKRRRSGRSVLRLHLATDNAEIARSAMERAAEMLQAAATGTFAYDGADNVYHRVGPADSEPDLSTVEDDEHSTDDGGLLQRLRIANRNSGLDRAREARKHLLTAGGRALGSAAQYTTRVLVLSGFLARAQALHEGTVAAIEGRGRQRHRRQEPHHSMPGYAATDPGDDAGPGPGGGDRLG
jgi:hypothetical protein